MIILSRPVKESRKPVSAPAKVLRVEGAGAQAGYAFLKAACQQRERMEVEYQSCTMPVTTEREDVRSPKCQRSWRHEIARGWLLCLEAEAGAEELQHQWLDTWTVAWSLESNAC